MTEESAHVVRIERTFAALAEDVFDAVNSGISTEERRDAQDEGWHGCFDELERVLAR